MSEKNINDSPERAARGSSPAACSAAVWRVTADDDREKEWDSDNCDDAFMDADMAFMDGARKVTIQIITPPNAEFRNAASGAPGLDGGVQ